MADRWLHGRGVEIGGSGHNCFHLNTINVDHSLSEAQRLDLVHYKFEANVVAPIDVRAEAFALPFRDKAFDFLVASHVLEHVWDPISALREWGRVASRLCVIVPVPWMCGQFCGSVGAVRWESERCELRPEGTGCPVSFDELLARKECERPPELSPDRHVCCWKPNAFVELFGYLGMRVLEVESPDTKGGNGTLVVADA